MNENNITNKKFIRFEQRLSNYTKSLIKLHNVADNYDIININDKDRDSLIKRFELTFELAWNCYKDYAPIPYLTVTLFFLV